MCKTKKNAPAPCSALSYGVSSFSSGPSGDELALFKNVSQSERTSMKLVQFFFDLQGHPQVIVSHQTWNLDYLQVTLQAVLF